MRGMKTMIEKRNNKEEMMNDEDHHNEKMVNEEMTSPITDDVTLMARDRFFTILEQKITIAHNS